MTGLTKIDGFKLESPHREGCWCEHDKDGLVFIVSGGTVRLDKLGRPNASGGDTWYAFCCNDPKCRARMLVRWDVLSHFVSSRGGAD